MCVNTHKYGPTHRPLCASGSEYARGTKAPDGKDIGIFAKLFVSTSSSSVAMLLSLLLLSCCLSAHAEPVKNCTAAKNGPAYDHHIVLGAAIVNPKRHHDHRGYFQELYSGPVTRGITDSVMTS